MMAAIMAIWGLLLFLLVEVVIFLPLYIVGLPMAWLAGRYAGTHETPSRLFPDRAILAYDNPVLDWWVGNYEDGLKPVFDWWPAEKTAFQWFLRNPVCNLRFTPLISTKPSPNTQWVGSVDAVPANGVPGWFLAWSGPYVGFLWQNTRWGMWAGFKINPRDARFVPADDYRRWGLGTACQIMRF
jgi:hypothetical protein